jgi:hypothetical protein
LGRFDGGIPACAELLLGNGEPKLAPGDVVWLGAVVCVVGIAALGAMVGRDSVKDEVLRGALKLVELFECGPCARLWPGRATVSRASALLAREVVINGA